MTGVRRRRALALAIAFSLAWAVAVRTAWADPALTFEPDCKVAGQGGPIQVHGSGYPPGAVLIVAVGPVPPGTAPLLVTVRADGTFDTTVQWPAGRAAGSYNVTTSNRDGSNTLGFPFLVAATCGTTTTGSTTSSSSSTSTTAPAPTPTGTPRLELIPPIGPPGFVTLAVGSGFPANSAVELRWQPGLAGAQTVTDQGGGLSVPVLVMHRDLLGPRQLVAQAGAGILATTASAPFLVVPASLGPPEVSGPEPQLVFRR